MTTDRLADRQTSFSRLAEELASLSSANTIGKHNNIRAALLAATPRTTCYTNLQFEGSKLQIVQFLVPSSFEGKPINSKTRRKDGTGA